MTQAPTPPDASAPQEEGLLDLFESTRTTSADTGPRRVQPSPEVAEKRRRRRKLLAWLLALALLLTAALVGWYLLTRKPLSQLPGVNVVPMPSYKTSIYGVEKPLGVAATGDGSTVFVSHGGQKPGVAMFDRDGRRLRDLEFPAEPAYHVPVYLTVAPDGKLYVGDRAANAVHVFSGAGDYEATFAPADEKVLFSPLGVAVDADGSLYVADVKDSDPARHRILVFAADGTLTRTLGEGRLNYPNQLLVDAAGNVYATDSNNAKLVVITPDGELTMLMGPGAGAGDLGLPRGLGIDDRGRGFSADTTDHQVRVYTLGPGVTTPPTYVGSFGTAGVEDGQFQYPNGLAVDARARIYITDRENNRVQVWGF